MNAGYDVLEGFTLLTDRVVRMSTSVLKLSVFLITKSKRGTVVRTDALTFTAVQTVACLEVALAVFQLSETR